VHSALETVRLSEDLLGRRFLVVVEVEMFAAERGVQQSRIINDLGVRARLPVEVSKECLKRGRGEEVRVERG
jgi:hypothetical protein